MDKDVSPLPYSNARHIQVLQLHLATNSEELTEYAKTQLMLSAQRELA